MPTLRQRDLALIALSITIVMLLAGCTSSSSRSYAAVFSEIGVDPFTQQGYVDQGKTLNLFFQAPTKNMTKVDIQLAWYDDSGDGCPDVLAMEVKAPFTGATYLPGQLQQGTSNISIEVQIQDPPHMKEGKDKGALQDYLDGVANTQGTGNWTVSITCMSTQSNCPNPLATDPGNGWILSVTAYHFEGSISEID